MEKTAFSETKKKLNIKRANIDFYQEQGTNKFIYLLLGLYYPIFHLLMIIFVYRCSEEKKINQNIINIIIINFII